MTFYVNPMSKWSAELHLLALKYVLLTVGSDHWYELRGEEGQGVQLVYEDHRDMWSPVLRFVTLGRTEEEAKATLIEMIREKE